MSSEGKYTNIEHQNFFEGRATTYMKAGLKGNVENISFASV